MSTNISDSVRLVLKELATQMINSNSVDENVTSMLGFKLIRHTDTASGEVAKISAHAVIECEGLTFYLVQIQEQ
jgi:hypothetical protein